MVWWIAGVGLLALVGGFGFVRSIRERRGLRAEVLASGLDLPTLIALLPAELRDREYVDFAVSPAPVERGQVLVGLLYRPPAGVVFSGTPPNVGLKVHLTTREVIEVHAGGIGLGVA